MSVVERTDGDLILTIRGSPFIIDPSFDRNLASIDREMTDLYEIQDYHYSIHRSTNSPTLNTIKLTRKTVVGNIQTAVHYTNAIKSGSGFAPIFARRCNNFGSPEHKIKNLKKSESFQIGNVEPGFSLAFMVFVSSRNQIFRIQNSYQDFNVFQRNFREFQITLLYSFLNIPACEDSGSIHYGIPGNAMTLKSLTSNECIIHFSEARRILKIKLLDEIKTRFGNQPDMQDYLKLAEYAVYFKEATFTSEAIKNWGKLMVQMGIMAL